MALKFINAVASKHKPGDWNVATLLAEANQARDEHRWKEAAERYAGYLADFIRLKAGLCRISDRTTPSSSSEGHNSRADLGRDAVNALEVADAGSRGFAPRRLWPGLLKFERKEAEQLGFRAA
ncbi:MAG TPA: hypothetical protein VEI74_12640 [Candidatus Methylomirabilis sp.]|nr:hypothetical protein [Candidatus Methylomirabilis sp.]